MASGSTVLLVTNVYKPHIGGITNYVANLEKTLQGWTSPRVVAYPSRLVDFEDMHPGSVWRLAFHAGFVLRVFLAAVWCRLRKQRVIVHSHSASFCLAAAALCGMVGAASVHTFHSPPPVRRSLIIERLAPRLDGLVYVSQDLRERYESSLEPRNSNVIVIPGAVEIPPHLSSDERRRIREEFKAKWLVPPDAFLILLAGRLVADKGAHVLAKAISLLGNSSEYALVVGPSGPGAAGAAYANSVKIQAGPAVDEGRFQILGEVERGVLEQLYAASDVAVVPSTWPEPAPLVALEAMARGTPVIASRTGGIPAMVLDKEAGLLVPPDDPLALAEALRALRSDDSFRKRLGERARSLVEEQYSLPLLQERHRALYRGLTLSDGFTPVGN